MAFACSQIARHTCSHRWQTPILKGMINPTRPFLRLAIPICLLPVIWSGVAIASDCRPFTAIQTFSKTAASPSGATCSTYLGTQAVPGTSCYWEFPRRDALADGLAGKLWTDLQSCLPGLQLVEDKQVNHPDSYFLRQWKSSTGLFAISVKDKSALNRSFVFLRFEGK